ncbi:MAG: hypothetical protein WA581_17915, partial [Candidatus Acidiferrales bacterium]
MQAEIWITPLSADTYILYNQDMKGDTRAAIDRGEPVSLMEPLLVAEGSRHQAALTDLVVELAQKSA